METENESLEATEKRIENLRHDAGSFLDVLFEYESVFSFAAIGSLFASICGTASLHEYKRFEKDSNDASFGTQPCSKPASGFGTLFASHSAARAFLSAL